MLCKMLDEPAVEDDCERIDDEGYNCTDDDGCHDRKCGCKGSLDRIQVGYCHVEENGEAK